MNGQDSCRSDSSTVGRGMVVGYFVGGSACRRHRRRRRRPPRRQSSAGWRGEVRRAQGPLLPQPDGAAGHLADAEEGPDGHGLHPGVRGRGPGRARHRQGVSADRIQIAGRADRAGGLRSLARDVRAVGTIEIDERGQHTVAPKFEGWIEKLHVNTTGQAVARGQPLAEVYSPELVSAQREYLIAYNASEGDVRRRRGRAGRRAAARRRGARAPAQLGHQRGADGATAPGRRAAPHADAVAPAARV